MKSKKAWSSLFLAFFLFSFLFLTSTPTVEATVITMNRTFKTSSSDGCICKSSGSYGTARNATKGGSIDTGDSFALGQQNVTNYSVWRAFLYFNTAIIPNEANITNATLSIYIYADDSVTDFNITIQSGMPTYPHDPMKNRDYYYGYYSGNGGARNTSAISGLGYFNISLSSLGWVNKEGWTKLCLRSSNDINNVAPNYLEVIHICARNMGKSYAANLYVSYKVDGSRYILYGAYNEQGTRQGAINVAFFKETEGAETFELNGTETKDVEVTPVAFHFDLGYNTSRVYYLKDEFEEIYVFKPSDPYYTYYFSIVDYVGITNGYLETLINVNGTDRIVERWKLNVLNDIPYTLSWGVAYKIRLVCDQGTYVYGSYVAGATTSFTLTVTQQMFPPTSTHLGNVTVSAARPTATHISINYSDTANETIWVDVTIYDLTGSVQVYTTNNTGNNHQINWPNAWNFTDYRAVVTAGHEVRGTLKWSFYLPAPLITENPWDFSFLGKFPFSSSQLIGCFIVLLVFGCFSVAKASLAMIVGVITAMLLTAIGFLDISWTWLTITMGIAIIASLSIARKRSETGARIV